MRPTIFQTLDELNEAISWDYLAKPKHTPFFGYGESPDSNRPLPALFLSPRRNTPNHKGQWSTYTAALQNSVNWSDIRHEYKPEYEYQWLISLTNKTVIVTSAFFSEKEIPNLATLVIVIRKIEETKRVYQWN